MLSNLDKPTRLWFFYEANLQIGGLKPCGKIEVWQYTYAPIKSISDLLTSMLEVDKYFWITLMCITHSLCAKLTTLSQWKMCFREILFRFNPSWLLHWYTQHTTACNSYVLGTLSSAAPQHCGKMVSKLFIDKFISSM